MKKHIITAIAVLLIAIIAATVILSVVPKQINITVLGIRFPTDDPSSSQECSLTLDGKMKGKVFSGSIMLDGERVKTEIDFGRKIPTVSTYIGDKLVPYAIIFVWDKAFGKLTMELQETDEYVVCGMTLAEFEDAMSKDNNYIKYKDVPNTIQ